MTHPIGTCIGGVRTFDDIKARCRVIDDDPDTCWPWLLALDCRKTPKLWFSEFRSTVTLSSVVCFLKTGQRPGKGVAWYPHCGDKTCGNPNHWRAGTLSEAARRSPRKNPLLHAAKVAQTRRSMSLLDDEKVADIRSSTDKLQDCANRHGISKSSASRIRRGVAWAPLPVVGSSVFDWRP